MVGRRVSAVSNHEARGPSFEKHRFAMLLSMRFLLSRASCSPDERSDIRGPLWLQSYRHCLTISLHNRLIANRPPTMNIYTPNAVSSARFDSACATFTPSGAVIRVVGITSSAPISDT